MVVVATTEALPAASADCEDSIALGVLVDSVVVVSEPEHAERMRAEVARALRSAIFDVVMD